MYDPRPTVISQTISAAIDTAIISLTAKPVTSRG
jgi:hypothetical protein